MLPERRPHRRHEPGSESDQDIDAKRYDVNPEACRSRESFHGSTYIVHLPLFSILTFVMAQRITSTSLIVDIRYYLAGYGIQYLVKFLL